MSQRINTYSSQILLAILFLVVFAFWMFVHPEYLNYQEQNQLFLCTFEYLKERLTVPGGFSDWLGEAIAQFFYWPWLAALVMALFSVVLALATPLDKFCNALPALALLNAMGDSDLLMSYNAALLITLLIYKSLRHQQLVWIDICFLPLLYWLAGPMAALYLTLRIVDCWKKEIVYFAYLPIVILACYYFLLPQHSLQSVFLGINYYRIPEHYSGYMLLIPLTILLLYIFSKMRIYPKVSRYMIAVTGGILANISTHYDPVITEVLTQNMLIRQQKWTQIIERAENHQDENAYSSNAVNLALAMHRQLADRQFEFYQSGADALIMPSVRDNLSNAPSAEAFYQLGMVQSALRYAFDLQQSILNRRMSGRWSQRLAECYIVNGQYSVAQKYLDKLKQSLFYRTWAEEAETTMHSEEAINKHPEWGRLRRTRFADNFLYSYPEMDKMLGQLFISNKNNTMALDYFMAQMLLNGNVQGFAQYMGAVQQYGGYTQMPRGYQDAMRAIQSRGQDQTSKFAQYARRMSGAK